MTSRTLRRSIFNAMAQQVDREKNAFNERSRIAHLMAEIERKNAIIEQLQAQLAGGSAFRATITVQEAAIRAGASETTIWRHLNNQVKRPRWSGYFDEDANRWRVYCE